MIILLCGIVVILILSFTISSSSNLTGNSNMRSSHLMCHSKFLPPVTSLVSDMRSSYLMFHTQFQHPVTSMVSDMRSSYMVFIHNFNLQWPQCWVIWGHPSWCTIQNIFLQWPHWWVTWGQTTSCFIQYFDLQWPHWWVTWGHPNWYVIQNCALVISIAHHVSYNWAHRRSNFRVNEVILHDLHTQCQPPMTSVVSDMRSSFLKYHTQYLPPVTSLVRTWGHPITCFIQYFDLQWPHWWVTWGHPDWCVIQNCALVISIAHHVIYNWAHRRSNFRVTSHGTGFLVPPVRSLESYVSVT
jgi:hypothetical protein